MMNEVDPLSFLIYIKIKYTIKTNRVRLVFFLLIKIVPYINIHKIKHKKNEKISMLIGLLSVLAIVSCKEKRSSEATTNQTIEVTKEAPAAEENPDGTR
jgi:hypothetical protein